MSLSKKELRIIAKEKLKSFSVNDSQAASVKLSRQVLALLKELKSSHGINLFNPQSILGVYAPLGDEPWWPSVLGKEQINFAFPEISESGHSLNFIKSSLDQLAETDEFGVRILSPRHLGFKQLVTPDVLLIPGLGFSGKGERLGRGMGFYDRYLENYKGIRIGLCFDKLLFETIPTEEHDELLDFIVTERIILKIEN